LGKAIIFLANANLLGQKPAAKNEKKNISWYLLSEKKTEFIPPARQSA